MALSQRSTVPSATLESTFRVNIMLRTFVSLSLIMSAVAKDEPMSLSLH